jgi:hypothetical protein
MIDWTRLSDDPNHVCWITPTQALELARRAGISLAAYHVGSYPD